jgi:hypothetical protein
VLGNVALMAFVFLGSPTPKPTPMPNPNGYDDFVKAASVLNGKILSFKDLNKDELQALVSNNATALTFVRTGLDRECRVPDDYSSNYVARVFVPTLSNWKRIEILLCAEGRLAEMEGRTNDAMNCYLDGIRFGEQCSRGGVLVNTLGGNACQAIAIPCLEQLRLNLDAKQCARITSILESLNQGSDSPETIMQHEQAYEETTSGVREKIAKLVTFKKMRVSRKQAIDKMCASKTRRNEMMLSFAARAYELDKGKLPANIADLVPDYLKKIPQDPATGTNLVLIP